MTLDRQFVYTWDAENRLIEVQTRIDWGQYSDAYETGDKHIYFTYDYMGRRVRKRVETYNGSWPETSDELFVYDGWNVVMVLNANAGNAITRDFTWGLDLSGTIHGAGGIGGLLAAVVPWEGGNPGETARLWYFYDAEPLTLRATRSVGACGPRARPVRRVMGHGNVGQVLNATDTNNISIAAHYEYDPYGNLINSSGPYADANPFRFSTKWFDDETHLGYWGHRYYSPRLGRWISRDPIGEEGGANVYAYVENLPTNRFDWNGLGPAEQNAVLTAIKNEMSVHKAYLYYQPGVTGLDALLGALEWNLRSYPPTSFELESSLGTTSARWWWSKRLMEIGSYALPSRVAVHEGVHARNTLFGWHQGNGAAAVTDDEGDASGVTEIIANTSTLRDLEDLIHGGVANAQDKKCITIQGKWRSFWHHMQFGVLSFPWVSGGVSGTIRATDIWDINSKHLMRFSCGKMVQEYNSVLKSATPAKDGTNCCQLTCTFGGFTLDPCFR